jgi:hypothetical protein
MIIMASKLNRARQEQDFEVKGNKQSTIKTWKAAEKPDEVTIEQVFGKR